MRFLNYYLNVKGTFCCRCRESLEYDTIIKEGVKEDNGLLYCEKCAEYATDDELLTYINVNRGSDRALLVLDSTAVSILHKNTYSLRKWSNINSVDGSLDMTDIEDNSIVVIELYDKIPRALKQRRLINKDGVLEFEVKRFLKAEDDDARGVRVVGSGVTHRIYILYKADSVNEIAHKLCAVAGELQALGLSTTRTVYMERSEFDTDGLTKLLLAASGYKCEYFSGGAAELAKIENKTRIFNIDFTFEEFFEYIRGRIIGQDKELEKAAYLVYSFIDNASLGIKTRVIDWLLTAPSGMGKTEFFRAVRDYFKEHKIPVPVAAVDLSHITEMGFKGKNADKIVDMIAAAAPESRIKLPSGTAICFLDEADKKCIPSYESNGTNVNAAVQMSLLTMVEGTVMTDNDDNKFDTSNTMFIFMGAFQDLRDKKKENGAILHSIFGDDDEIETGEDCFFGDITPEDMIEVGMLEELAGRITISINFHKLPKEEMGRLIQAKAEQVGRDLNAEIKLTPKAIEDLTALAYSNLGVRAPTNKLMELVVETLAENYRKGGYDKARDVIVIKSKSSAEIRSKDSVNASGSEF